MAKRKKRRKRQEVAKATHRAQKQAASITQQRAPDETDPRLQAEAQERYRCKQIRRQITKAFTQLCSTGEMPTPDAIRGFLVEYLDDIELMRDALRREKQASDPWSIEIWRLLSLEDSELRFELSQILEEKRFAIEAAKMLIRHNLPDPLVLHIPTTTDGPDYESVGQREISDAIATQLGEDCVRFEVEGDFSFSWPDEYQVRLHFDMGDPLSINIRLALELDGIPEDFQEDWTKVDVLPVSPDSDMLVMLRDQLRQSPRHSEEGQLRVTQILKTAHAMGYWKTIETQRLLQRWRAEEQAIKVTAEVIDVTEILGVTSMPQMEGLQKDEAEKLQVLDLPPLISYDLVHATVDVNVLQRLFVMPKLKHLRNVELDDFSEADIRALVPGRNWRISDLKKGRYGKRAVDTRALAKILLSVARLQFEKLEIGTSEADIRFCLSNYSTRMGEYLVQQHGRYDLARDYYLEAISLNMMMAKARIDFPTMWLFRSFPNDRKVVQEGRWTPRASLTLLTQPQWQTIEVARNAIRSFIELGTRHFQWASRWFSECLPTTQNFLLSPARHQLGLGDLADLSLIVSAPTAKDLDISRHYYVR